MMDKTILELPGFTLIYIFDSFPLFHKEKVLFLFSFWLHAGSSSVGLPSKWNPMKSNQTMMEVTLRPGDKEYDDVLRRFQTSAGGGVKVSEVQIISTCQGCMYPYVVDVHLKFCEFSIYGYNIFTFAYCTTSVIVFWGIKTRHS